MNIYIIFTVGGPKVDLYHILDIEARHTESEVVPVFVFGMFLGSGHTKPQFRRLDVYREMLLLSHFLKETPGSESWILNIRFGDKI